MKRVYPAVLSLLLFACVPMDTYQKRFKDVQSLEAERNELRDENRALRNKLEATEQDLQASAAKQENVTDVRQAYEDLIAELKEFIAAGGVGVEARGEGLLITMKDQVLFKSGRAALQKDGRALLKSIASVLSKTEGFYVRVGGHTDNIPISKSLRKIFPTNWELSAMRSSTVVRYFIDAGIDPSSLILAAFSEYHPVADNSTAEGRRINRRVEITLVRKDLYQ